MVGKTFLHKCEALNLTEAERGGTNLSLWHSSREVGGVPTPL